MCQLQYSEIGKQIGQSTYGIVIHSKIAEPGADVEPVSGATVTGVPELFVADQNIKDSSASVELDTDKVAKLNAIDSSQIDRLFDPGELRSRQISDFPKLFKMFINSKVRAGNYDNLIKDFQITYIYFLKM